MTSDDQPLRVAFDATATPEKLTGAGFYVQQVLSGLDGREDIDLSIVTRKNDGQRFSGFAPSAKIIEAAPTSKAARIAFQTFKLGSLIDSLNVDVFHGPHYQLPEKMQTPSVVTIHDTTLLTHHDVHTRAKSLFFSRVIPRSCHRARSVIAVSQHTADDVDRLIDNHGKLFVAPLGIDRTRFHHSADADDKQLLYARGITEPYIAFLGAFEPRKSIPTLIKAFALIADNFPELRLVLGGPHGWGAKEVRKAIVDSGVATRIIAPGRLENNEIGPFLRSAEIFVYPSLYEGFGMPVAEAMACGTPTITTNSSSLREVAGKGALLFEPEDVMGLVELMTSLLEHKTLYSQMAAKALRRAEGFSWEECVDAHVDAYKFASD